MLHASQPVPTAQWPELAARSFSWLWQNEKWLRMHQGDGLNVLHVSQLVPTAQWPELAARSLQLDVANGKWLRMHQGGGLNVLHVSQLVPMAQWPELAARSFQLVVARRKMAADASKKTYPTIESPMKCKNRGCEWFPKMPNFQNWQVIFWLATSTIQH